MHVVRRELLEAQAASVGLPLWTVPLPHPCPNAIYEERMREAIRNAVHGGFTHVAFGDLFLEDVRRYRERGLAGTGLEPLFPLWGASTAALAEEMIASGLRARLACVDTRVLPAPYVGREFDRDLLRELPPGVDPCGENGEFHTFVSDGPGFSAPIPYQVGDVVLRDDRFAFCDLLPAGIRAD